MDKARSKELNAEKSKEVNAEKSRNANTARSNGDANPRVRGQMVWTNLFKRSLLGLGENKDRKPKRLTSLDSSHVKKELLKSTCVTLNNDASDVDSGIFSVSSEKLVDTEDIRDHRSTIYDKINRKLTVTCSNVPFHPFNEDCENKSPNCHERHLAGISKLLRKELEEQACLDQSFVRKFVDSMNRIVMKHFPGCEVKLYGSYLSGFATANSNINLELSTMGISFKAYRPLAKLLVQEKPEFNATLHEDSEKTFVSLIEPKLETYCELHHLGRYKSYYLVSELMRKILLLDPKIKELVICLRHWAEVCSLDSTDNGRLQPLAFAFMVIYYLQRTTPPVLPTIDISIDVKESIMPNVKNEQKLEELWLGLLAFYGKEFNWTDNVISITRNGTTVKDVFKWKQCWIGIESPYDENINIANSVVNQDISYYIQQCFNQSYRYFSNPVINDLSDDSDSTGNGHDVEQEYDYCFDCSKLTGGVAMPSLCPECNELGYSCPDCIEDGCTEFEDLPPTTPLFLEKIKGVLEEVYETHAVQDLERINRINFVADLEKYIQRKFYDANLQLIGSSMNGFGFKNSDLDICMTFKNRNEIPTDPKRILRQLCSHLRCSQRFSSVIVLYSAKIPVIQFHYKRENLRGDISLYNLLAVENTALLRCYSKIDKRVRVLGCAMKLLAKNAGIADTSQRSLSSYSYIIMVIHFLQQTNPPVLPVLQELPKGWETKEIEGCDVTFFKDINKLPEVWRSNNRQSVEKLWLDLIKYYTEGYDPTAVITIRQKEIKYVTRNRARLFNIQDPFITSKNLGSVLSDEMSVKTSRTLLQARKLFSSRNEGVPPGYNSLMEFLFHPRNLSNGYVIKAVECPACGKIGHTLETCKRYNWKSNLGLNGIRR